LLAACVLYSCGAPPEDEPLAPAAVFTLDKPAAAVVARGEPATLTLTMENVSEYPEWTSSDGEIARVTPGNEQTDGGKRIITASVQGFSAGDAVITVTAGSHSAACAVTVNAEDSLSVTNERIDLLAGRREKISVQTNLSPVTFTSSGDTVARVSTDGYVTGVSGGEAIVTVKAGGKSVLVYVYVTDPELSLEESAVVLFTGEERLLTFACNGVPDWSTDKPSVATVTQDGLVKGMGEGAAVVSVAYGSAEKTCAVTVRDEKYEITLSAASAEVAAGGVLSLSASVKLYSLSQPDGVYAGGGELVGWRVVSGEGIVSVSADGTVTAAGGYGAATVRAVLLSDEAIFADCVINVPDPRADWIAVSTKEELYSALGNTANADAKIYLLNDIDCGGDARGQFMESFGGTLDGDGYGINNLRLNRFFTTVTADAVIENLSVTLTDTGAREYGTFAHAFAGIMRNCRLDITFTSSSADHKSAVALVATGSRLSNLIVLLRGSLGANAHVLFGQGGGNKSNVFYHSYMTTSVANADGAVSKTETELTQAATFAGWDETVWHITDGEIPTLVSGAYPEAREFIRLVGEIPALAALLPSDTNRARIASARAYYGNSLSEEDKALNGVVTALATLEAAEAGITAFEAEGKTFTDRTDGLDSDALLLADKPAVTAARAAYNGLSGGAKTLNAVVSAEAKLRLLEAKIAALEEEVRLAAEIAAFEALVDFGNPVTLADGAAITAAYAAYENLSAAAKASDGIAVAKAALDSANEAFNAILIANAPADAQGFATLVEAFGSPVTLADKLAVLEAREAYVSLSEYAKEQPAAVAALAVLEAAEEAIAAIEAEAEADALRGEFLEKTALFDENALALSDRPLVAAARAYYDQNVTGNALAVNMPAVLNALDKLTAAEAQFAASDARVAELVRLTGLIPATVSYSNVTAFLAALDAAEAYYAESIAGDALASGWQAAKTTLEQRRSAYDVFAALPAVSFADFHNTVGVMDGLVYDPASSASSRGILGGSSLIAKVRAKFGGSAAEAAARCKILITVKRGATTLFTIDFPWSGTLSDADIKQAYDAAGYTRQVGDRMYFKVAALPGGNVIGSTDFGMLTYTA
jgi:hypothetical protein